MLVRPETKVPVKEFDGKRIPHPDKSFDVVMFVDVLHHTEDPTILLAEARRVAKPAVVLKDHCKDGVLANSTLRFMDAHSSRSFHATGRRGAALSTAHRKLVIGRKLDLASRT